MSLSAHQFEIIPSSGIPIYRQIMDQVHALIAGGKLKQGDFLPSVRQVAGTAAVNPMTVSKAYSRLEADGVVKRVRGQGMRVETPTVSGSVSERKEKLAEFIAPSIHRARQLGLNEKQLRAVIESILKDYTS